MTTEEQPGEAERDGEPEASTEAPEPAEAPEVRPEPAEQPKIWDPVQKRWVSADELRHGDAVRAERDARAGSAGGLPAWATGLLAGVAGAALVAVALLFVPGVIDRSPRRQPAAGQPAFEGTGETAAVDTVRTVRPWVAHVEATGSAPTLLGPREFRRAGSGMVLHPDGIIAVPARLVDQATVIRVTFSSGRTADATLLGVDKLSDVAGLRVEAPDLVAAQLGTIEALDLGQRVVALSAPAGIGVVAQTGTISAIGQTVDPGDGSPLVDLLQVDAPLAGSGPGGVVVGQGQAVVGMVASYADAERGFGYVVPIDVVRLVVERLMSGEKVVHPWIGLTADPLDADTAFRADALGAVIVTSVFEDGPAQSAGLKPGDVIVGVDGVDAQGPMSLLKRVLDHQIGDTMVLLVRRGGDPETVNVTVVDRGAA